MGQADTPVRKVLNYASDNFANHLPIVYIQTVVGKSQDGKLGVSGSISVTIMPTSSRPQLCL